MGKGVTKVNATEMGVNQLQKKRREDDVKCISLVYFTFKIPRSFLLEGGGGEAKIRNMGYKVSLKESKLVA